MIGLVLFKLLVLNFWRPHLKACSHAENLIGVWFPIFTGSFRPAKCTSFPRMMHFEPPFCPYRADHAQNFLNVVTLDLCTRTKFGQDGLGLFITTLHSYSLQSILFYSVVLRQHFNEIQLLTTRGHSRNSYVKFTLKNRNFFQGLCCHIRFVHRRDPSTTTTDYQCQQWQLGCRQTGCLCWSADRTPATHWLTAPQAHTTHLHHKLW